MLGRPSLALPWRPRRSWRSSLATRTGLSGSPSAWMPSPTAGKATHYLSYRSSKIHYTQFVHYSLPHFATAQPSLRMLATFVSRRPTTTPTSAKHLLTQCQRLGSPLPHRQTHRALNVRFAKEKTFPSPTLQMGVEWTVCLECYCKAKDQK